MKTESTKSLCVLCCAMLSAVPTANICAATSSQVQSDINEKNIVRIFNIINGVLPIAKRKINYARFNPLKTIAYTAAAVGTLVASAATFGAAGVVAGAAYGASQLIPETKFHDLNSLVQYAYSQANKSYYLSSPQQTADMADAQARVNEIIGKTKSLNEVIKKIIDYAERKLTTEQDPKKQLIEDVIKRIDPTSESQPAS